MSKPAKKLRVREAVNGLPRGAQAQGSHLNLHPFLPSTDPSPASTVCSIP